MATNETRVLIVDDDVDICANICDILSDIGYRADVAHDGPSALQLIRDNTYDVAVIDFKMPGMDGATLYSEMKKLRPEIVAIMVTAHTGSSGAQRALEAGTWKVLRKPVDIKHLLSLIEEVVRAPIVLVVDDDCDFCETLWQVLREKGYRVAIACSEQEGIRKALDSPYQVALVDLHLGQGDGRSVLECIHQTCPTTKTVIVTGFRNEADQISAGPKEKAAKAVCYKPVDLSELLSVIGDRN